jgi:hypothetical protein
MEVRIGLIRTRTFKQIPRKPKGRLEGIGRNATSCSSALIPEKGEKGRKKVASKMFSLHSGFGKVPDKTNGESISKTCSLEESHMQKF